MATEEEKEKAKVKVNGLFDWYNPDELPKILEEILRGDTLQIEKRRNGIDTLNARCAMYNNQIDQCKDASEISIVLGGATRE